ncbi:MAG: phosphatase PAP2 family protein [Candidatus Dormiibacterota bacterium]
MSESAVDSTLADGSQAAHEVLAGEPGPVARRWLGPLALISFALFALVTILVASGATRSGFDIPVERAIQHAPWGPLTYWMTLTNVTGGLIQDLVGLVVVVGIFLWDRRAGWLMALGAIGSLLDQIVKVSVARHRPTADLVTILNPSNGYSYPSGHALFFTWLTFMLVIAIAPHVGPRWRVAMWVAAAFVIVFASIGRIWAGAHWPTDVIGGFLLGAGWSAFILWLPERWLPTPSARWIPRRRSASRRSHA